MAFWIPLSESQVASVLALAICTRCGATVDTENEVGWMALAQPHGDSVQAMETGLFCPACAAVFQKLFWNFLETKEV